MSGSAFTNDLRDLTGDGRVKRRSTYPGMLAAALLISIAIVYLYTVWSVSHFPSEDGPQHIYNAEILREYHWPDRPAFREYFRINHRLVPNWLTTLILSALLTVLPAADADKFLVSAYVVCFLLSANYLVRSFNRSTRLGFLLFLPFCLNVLVFRGFENFYCGIPLLLFIIGFECRRAGRTHFAGLAVLGTLATVLYFFHAVSFCVCCLVIALIHVAELIRPDSSKRHFPSSTAASHRLGRFLLPLLVLMPGVSLLVKFLFTPSVYGMAIQVGLGDRARRMFTWGEVFQADQGELSTAVTVVFALFSLVIAAARLKKRAWVKSDTLLVAAAAMGTMDLLVPDAIGGGSFMVERLNLLGFIFWAAWLAAQPPPTGWWPAAHFTTALLALFILLSLRNSMLELDSYVTEYVSCASSVLPGSTFLSVQYSVLGYTPDLHLLSSRVPPFYHVAGWVATQRHAVDVTNFEAFTGYFPLLFQPGRDVHEQAYDSLGEYAFKTRVHGGLDQVVIWTSGLPNPAESERFTRDLHKDYRRTFRSDLRGYVEVFQRVDLIDSQVSRPSR